MINIIQFHEELTDSDFYKQITPNNIQNVKLAIGNLINKSVPPFQVNLGSLLTTAFTVSVEVYNTSNIETPTDITAELQIVRVKNDDTGDLYVFHNITEVVDSLLKGLIFFKIIATDGVNSVIRYSDILCAIDGLAVESDFDILDGGQNSPLSGFDILDGGQNAVLD